MVRVGEKFIGSRYMHNGDSVCYAVRQSLIVVVHYIFYVAEKFLFRVFVNETKLLC